MLLLRDPLSPGRLLNDPRFAELFGEVSRGELLRASDPKPDGARPRSVVLPCADHDRPLLASGAFRMCD